MPRARTQLGSDICAETESEFATVIQAMPAASIAGTAIQVLLATAITAVAADCTAVPPRTMASRPKRWRMRGSTSTAMIAPAPMLASRSVKVPASPPCMPLASSGNRPISASEWKKKMVTRSRTASSRGDWRTNCTPTRIALMSRSCPSGCCWWVWRQRRTTRPEITQSSALRANTQTLPALAMSAPATSGPTMRERFIATPFRASAEASWARGTRSGTIAENTGQRRARPMPLRKTREQQRRGHEARAVTAQSASAVAASQNWVNISQRRRSRMSASAPLGRPSRNTGRVEADCTSATQIGVVVSVVMVQAAATSLIHMHRLATSQVLQSRRNTGTPSGWRAVTERRAARRGGGAASSGGSEGGIGTEFPPRPRFTRMAHEIPSLPSLPLLALPGLLLDERMWRQQAAALAPAHPLTSFAMTPQPTIGELAEMALARAPAGRFALAGLSMGGYVAFEIVRRAPERVAALALLDTSARPDSPEQTALRRSGIAASASDFEGVVRGLFPRLLHPAHVGDASLTGLLMEMALSIGREGYVRQQEAIIGRIDSRPTLARIACPTLVLCGREDAILPLELSEEIHAGIPGSRMVVVEKSGHMSAMEQPEAVNAALREWLADC